MPALRFFLALLLAAPALAAQTTYISGQWYFGLASCGGKPFSPFNFTANACTPLDDNGQLQFKGGSVRLSQPDASRATATLAVFYGDACGGQATNWGEVADKICQMSYWSTKYTFDTKFQSY